MRFNLWTPPIHFQIWTLTIDMLAPQIFWAYLEFAWHQILIVHRSFGFIHLTYSKFVLQIFFVCKFDDKFRISEWICGYHIWIPIFQHYDCIANAFARRSNLALSAVLMRMKKHQTLKYVLANKHGAYSESFIGSWLVCRVLIRNTSVWYRVAEMPFTQMCRFMEIEAARAHCLVHHGWKICCCNPHSQ